MNSLKVIKKQVDYHSADKLSWRDYFKVVPRELIPTKRMNWIFGAIFIVVIIIGLFQTPWGSLFSFSGGAMPEGVVEIGFPWTFVEFDLGDPSKIPFKIGGLFFDLMLYLVVAYLIDVVISVFMMHVVGNIKKDNKSVKLYQVQSN